MKHNRILSFAALLALLCIPGLSRAQQTLTVYDGTETDVNLPAYIFYWDDYTKSQYIIPAADLTAMSGGTISALTFYTTDEDDPYTSESVCDVYLKEVPTTTLSAFVPKSSATVVYSGTVTIVASGTMTITFSTPFAYNGGNLLIGFENTTDADYEDIYFYGQEVDYICGGSNYSSTGLDNVTFSGESFIPKTTFTYSGGSSSSDLVIGDPNTTTSNYNMPVNTYYNYSLTETILDASELGGAMSIESISYKYAHTSPMTASKYGVKIWIKPTALTTFSSTSDMEPVDNTATLVYDGPIACSQGWNEIAFTTPYSYSGSGNLMVIVCDTVNGFDGSAYKFYTSSCTGNKTLVWQSDNAVPDAHSNTFSGGKAVYAYRPLMMLGVGGSSVDCSGVLDLPFSCGFESTDNLDCWTFIDANNDGYGWTDNVTMGTIQDWEAPPTIHHNGTGCYMSASYIEMPVTPDNWMVTPKLHIPSGGATLEWWDFAASDFDYAEHYSVLVSTTGTATANFTGNLFETTLTQGESWTQRSVSLAAYAGQDIYIAFRHYNCYDEDDLCIDDISVTAGGSAPEPLTVTLAGPTSGAANTPLTFTATGPGDADYAWYADDYFDIDESADGYTAELSWLVAGTYKVRVTATRGSESASDSLMVTISRRNPETTITSTAQWYGLLLAGSHERNFVKFTMQQPEQHQAISEDGNHEYVYAAEYANGNVYLFDAYYDKLHSQPFNEANPSIVNLSSMTEIGTVTNNILDMSYNVADNTMYGMVYNDDYEPQLASINLTTGAVTLIGTAPSVDLTTLAIDGAGNAYSIATNGKLYSVNLANGSLTEIGNTGVGVYYDNQSMSFDRATGELFWSQLSSMDDFGLYKVNTTTGHADFVGWFGNYMNVCHGLFTTFTSAPTPTEVSISAPATAVAGTPVTFTAVGPANGTYVWTFTGGTPATATTQSATVTWDEPGTYSVTLIAVVGGQTQTLTHSITITDANTVTIDAPATAVAGTPVTFTAQGPASGTYVWTFPSATPATATTQSATATWNDPGTYTVTLIAVVNGQTQTLTHSITITDANTVTIVAPATATVNATVTFYAQGPANGTYVWTFPSGNPAAAATQSATTTWAEAGTYTVSLMAVIEGQTQNLTHTITITGSTGIDDASAAAFGLYPNPATDQVTLTLGEAAEVTLHDLTGRELLRLQLPAGQHTLDLTPYAAGTYFLRAGGSARKLVVR